MSIATSNSTFANIRSERDFGDFLRYQPTDNVAALKSQLHEAVVAAGNTRTEFTEFCKQRLVSVRRFLRG